MSSINKKTTTIGGKSKIKPRRIASVEKNLQSNDDIVLAKSSKLTYYILGGITIVSIVIVGALLFKYFESNKQPLKVEQEEVKAEISKDDSVLMDEGNVQPQSINLDPKTKEEQYSLGVRYLRGNGVDKNYAEAIKWFTLSATQEHSDSQLMLGKVYYYGEFVKPDFKKALMWNTLAAAQGLSEAQYLLGMMYENGSGVAESKVEAKKWYTLAANQGMNEAKEKLLTAQSSHNYKTFTPAMTPKLVTHEDLNQVDKYLSNIKKNQSKPAQSRDANNREIIWN